MELTQARTRRAGYGSRRLPLRCAEVLMQVRHRRLRESHRTGFRDVKDLPFRLGMRDREQQG